MLREPASGATQARQACEATGCSEALSWTSWAGARFLGSKSVSRMNNPWRSTCMSTSTYARASSVKLLASRISRKGGFWGSEEMMADKIIPLGKQKETLCKHVALNFLQVEGYVSQLCLPVLVKLSVSNPKEREVNLIFCENRRDRPGNEKSADLLPALAGPVALPL